MPKKLFFLATVGVKDGGLAGGLSRLLPVRGPTFPGLSEWQGGRGC